MAASLLIGNAVGGGARRLVLPLLVLSGCGTTSGPPTSVCEQHYLKLLPSSGLQDATFWLSDAPLKGADEPIYTLNLGSGKGLTGGIIKLLSTERSHKIITLRANGPIRTLISYGCSRETDDLKLHRVVLRDKNLGSTTEIEADFYTGN